MKYLPNQNNMKPVFAAISLFILALIVSCGPAKNDSRQESQTPVIPPNQAETSSAEPEAPVLENPETTSQVSPEENNSQVKINPPHGEPGHRCDIPVGEPLNAQPAGTTRQTPVNPPANAPAAGNNPTAPTIENAQKLNSSQPSNTSSAQNSGRINPPHGQPGHRCDIPVGSPLP
ncbi:MAG: hypothetical protein ACOC1D_04020 [Prolixibacteraceae bacterium]